MALTATFTCSRALLCSGLFGYLVVGVATETRYHYWSIMAITLGIILILFLCRRRSGHIRRVADLRWRLSWGSSRIGFAASYVRLL